MRERLINRRQQGDLGEVSAMEWLTRQGATVYVPMGHSPDVDLVAQVDGRLVRVQVKTSVCSDVMSDGRRRFSVRLATSGGNQSWTKVVKVFDRSVVDAVFVLTGDGRRWFIPAEFIDAQTAIDVGGTKYSEFEIEPGAALEQVVYSTDSVVLESPPASGVYRSGQTGGAVNAMALSFAGSNPAAPTRPTESVDRPRFERTPARNGQTILGAKRRLGIPVGPCTAAGLSIGDRMRVRADGPGRVILERIDPGADTLAADELPGLELADGS